MVIERKPHKFAAQSFGLTVIATLVLAGCTGADITTTPAAPATTTPVADTTPAPLPAPTPITLSGVAVKGRWGGARATAWEIDAKGSHKRSLGSADTDKDGAFKITLSDKPASAVSIEITGGTYKSESDGTDVSGSTTKPTCALLPLAKVIADAPTVAVTPLSDIACVHAVTHAAGGTGLDTAIGDADKFVSATFGLATGTSLATLVPDFTTSALTAKTDAAKLALAIAALDGLAAKLATGVTGVTREDVYPALSKDYSDGLPDGKGPDGGAVKITKPTGEDAASLPATALGFDLAKELGSVKPSTFTGGDATTAVTAAADDIGGKVTSIIPSSVLTATGIASTSSGAMSYASIAGKQYLFVAARAKGVRKVDVTDPAAPVEITSTSTPAWKGADVYSKNFLDTPIGGAVVVSSSTGVQILAFAYGAKHIAFLDPDSGAVLYEGDLTLSGPLQRFSGGNAYIAGAIPDPGKGVWLATTDGYQYLDINKTLAADNAGKPPVMGAKFASDNVLCCSGGGKNQLSENLGGDIANNLLWTPNYGGLSLTLVADTKGFTAGRYALDPAYYATGSGRTVLSGNMDAGSVDVGLGVGIITYEDRSNVSFINLKGVKPGTSTVPTSGVKFDGYFLPPDTNGFVDVTISTSFLEYSGTAVDSKTHQLIGMAGYSNDIFVGILEDPSKVASGTPWKGMTDWVYYTLTSYQQAHDPHANVTVFNDKTGKTYAYLLDGDPSPSGVQQVDITAMLALTRAGTTGDAAHQIATGTNPQAAGGPITKIPLAASPAP